MKLIHECLDSGDSILARLFAGGAACGAFMAVSGIVTDGLGASFVVVYALLGAALLPTAELASRLVKPRWAQGLVFGAVAGLLGALCNQALFADGALPLFDLLAGALSGALGGLIFKMGARLEQQPSQNGTAARMR